MPVITEDGIEVYENDIELYLKKYEEENKVDCHKISQSRWNSVLRYIRRHVFTLRPGDIKYNNRKSNLDYNDHDLIIGICEYYADLCYEYEKEISQMGFSNLTGISRETLNSWGKEEYRAYEYYDSSGNVIKDVPSWILQHQGEEYTKKLGSSYSDIYKKIDEHHEESLRNKQFHTVMGPTVLLNHDKQYNMPGGGAANGRLEKRRTIEQIEQERGRRFIDTAPKELPKGDF